MEGQYECCSQSSLTGEWSFLTSEPVSQGVPGLARTFLGFLVLLLWDPLFLKIFPSPSPSLSQESLWQSWTYCKSVIVLVCRPDSAEGAVV